ncbi:MAG TPA: sugar transferase [Acidobacteriota bacterium]|nr:sugar transferase [Acidobacteriota bacterium]
MKRAFDILLSGAGLLLSSPLWLVIACAIKLEDRDKVFLTQQRVGKDGRLFRAYKFRSMAPHAQRLTPNLQATEDDPRVTRVGRILRATAMDELPQLLNIFLGDMSFVGPRALLPDEVEVHGEEEDPMTVDDLFRKRCTVTPGLTGIAQIFAPRDVPRRRKFRYDLLYIRKQSFLLDLKLIFLSFWITLRGKWETREKKLGRTKK